MWAGDDSCINHYLTLELPSQNSTAAFLRDPVSCSSALNWLEQRVGRTFFPSVSCFVLQCFFSNFSLLLCPIHFTWFHLHSFKTLGADDAAAEFSLITIPVSIALLAVKQFSPLHRGQLRVSCWLHLSHH